MDKIQLENIIKGVFLLLLAVSGNFVAETLGCKTQKLLSENMYAKHVVIFAILYFSIGFVSNLKPTHPAEIFKLCLIVYCLFIFFTKMNLTFTIIAFTLLAATYVNYTFMNYYNDTVPDDIALIEKHENIQNMLYMALIGTILVGFSSYYIDHRKEYKNEWSNMIFFFGKNKCKSLD